MNNLVKIQYSGKEYVGQIKSIDSEWATGYIIGVGRESRLRFYRVCILEKDTFCEIDHIYIHDISEIKSYEPQKEGETDGEIQENTTP